MGFGMNAMFATAMSGARTGSRNEVMFGEIATLNRGACQRESRNFH
jgi:hypothetical protein